MSSYYKFNFEKYFNIDINSFIIEQEEILLLESDKIGKKFKKNIVNYVCNFIKQKDWQKNKPTIIIPIKDNLNLLNFTIKNLINNDVNKCCNIIVVDDRSSEENIKITTLENNLSYLRVENKKGFNFSMLNNIAALIAKKLDSELIVLWNSDLWTKDKDTVKNLIEKHIKENSTISGTKLIYPPEIMSFRSEKYLDDFIKKNKNRFETIQFGGSTWIYTDFPLKYSPMHYRRFKEQNDILATCDKTESFITGAFQIINLDWFIRIGGLNPSLSKNFQDVDICLKALEENKKISYFGKDYFLLHDESVSLEKEGKHDNQLLSDHVLFGKIWNDKLEKLIF